MNTSIVLNQSTLASFDRELDDIAQYWQRVTTPLTLSWTTFCFIKDSFAQLIASQEKTLVRLKDFGLTLDGLAHADDYALDSEVYAALRHLNDTYQEYYDLCLAMQTGHNSQKRAFSTWWRFIYILSSNEACRIRDKVMKTLKRHMSKTRSILAKVDANVAVNQSKFVTLDADTLWQNRCKAYEYLL